MKKILVAEDENAIRDIIAINLMRAGYEVVQASDGRQALKLFNISPGSFDVVLLDIMMPILDGVSVCKAIREANANTGIILLTAKTQETICPMTVAAAAPFTPMAGQPSRPKIIMGSRMRLVTAPVSIKTMGQIILPVACNIFSTASSIKQPKENTHTTER